MFGNVQSQLDSQLRGIQEAGLFKSERILASPQNARVDLPAEKGVLNLCANNYFGLANYPEVVRAAHEAQDRWGYGLSSVRFICGTQEIHRELERRLGEFLGMEKRKAWFKKPSLTPIPFRSAGSDWDRIYCC
jgi:glycine C-acetyltransferase